MISRPFPRHLALALLALSMGGGCATDRHLVFFTNTSTGLEVGSDPSGTPKVLIGYNRQEGTVFPVYDVKSRSTTTPPDGGPSTRTETGELRDTAYSVIAKYAGESKADSAGMSNAQWFATGEAARRLANQPGIAGAVTGSPQIAEAASRQSSLLGDTTLPSTVKTAALWAAFEFVANQNSDEARSALAALNGFASTHFTPAHDLYFIQSPALPGSPAAPGVAAVPPTPAKVGVTPKGTPLQRGDYRAINDYDVALEDSIEAIELLLTDSASVEVGQALPPDAARRAELLSELDSQKERLSDFRQEVRESVAVLDVLRVLQGSLHQGGK